MGTTYTAEQIDTLTNIIVAGSVLSMIGSLFIVINYFMLSSLRNNFAFKLILWVAITDLIDSVGSIVPVDENGSLCIIQSMTKQFGDNASLSWVVAIAWTIYHLTNAQKIPTKPELNKLLKKMHVVIWSITIVTTILPLATNSYGVAGGWCWIKDETSVDTMWRYVVFYVPLWICIIYMIVVYVKVWKKLVYVAQQSDFRQQQRLQNVEEADPSTFGITQVEPHQEILAQQNTFEEDNDEMQEIVVDISNNNNNDNIQQHSAQSVERENSEQRKNTTLQRMKYYPLILIFCYFFASIRRITDLFLEHGEHPPFVLAGLHFFFESIIGFCDGIAYGLTPEIRHKDKELIKSCCVREQRMVDLDFKESDSGVR